MYLICPDPHPSIFQLYQSGEVGALEASEKLQDQRSWAFKFSSLVFILRARAQLHSVLLCGDSILKNESKPQSQRLIGHWPWVSSYRSGGSPSSHYTAPQERPNVAPAPHLPSPLKCKEGTEGHRTRGGGSCSGTGFSPCWPVQGQSAITVWGQGHSKINREAVRKETVHLQGTSRRKV